jgi:hypothetical protein
VMLQSPGKPYDVRYSLVTRIHSRSLVVVVVSSSSRAF